MTDGSPSKARSRFTTGLIVFGFVAGIAMICIGVGGFGPPRPDPEDSLLDGAPPGHDPMRASVPTAVRIPGIDVESPLIRVGLDPEGWIEAPPPQDPWTAGWYDGSVGPGAKGTAVLVGHVDSAVGPAVFYNAGALKKGNRIEVERADGTTAVFTVYRVKLFDAEDFPGERVYRDTRHAELRLLTCGGDYTPGAGYSGNTVVFARLTAVA
ncbi:class F sortase [Streptomyces sp. NPDC051940]|uniref:class F sortase n=1 Tax=Streptomyces sp. NPDC051940 TaxID=3155675 RepID=UPI00341A5080